jgi:dihydroxy-acid dehydratase
VKLGIDDFERLASELPCLVNLQPSGEHLMEDFCYAGGLPVVMKEISHLLHLDHVTGEREDVRENIAPAENFDTRVIKPFASRSRTRPASPCCAATSRRAARSSSRARRRRR